MRFALTIVMALVMVSPCALASDTFFECAKKGFSTTWVNGPKVHQYKKAGYRCTPRMRFGSARRDPAPSTRIKRKRGKTWTRSKAPVSRKRQAPAGDALMYESVILKASKKYNVPADLVRAVIRVESDFHPHAVSSAGAEGLMQLMPKTAKSLGVEDSFDPAQNIMGGTRYLRTLANQFDGDVRLTLAAYHAGPGAVARAGSIPYKATERYVRKVLKHYYRYRTNDR